LAATGAGLGALLATTLGAAATASTSTDTGRILFWTTSSGHPGVWEMRPDGSQRRLLTRFYENAKRGVLSPDGRRLAFDGAARGVAPMTNFDVQVMDVDGSHRTRLTSSPARELDPQWSPYGRQISYTRQLDRGGRKVEVWVMNADGSGKRRLTAGLEARWAPDGQSIAFTRWVGAQTDLFVLDLASGATRPLPSTPGLEELGGWSPDGRLLAYTRETIGGAADVYTIRADGTDPRRLTRGRGAKYAAGFSPDGGKILFTSDRTGTDQVFVMRADGGGQRRISRGGPDEEAIQWHR
jgi:TolB protein